MLRIRVQLCWQMTPTVTCNTSFSLQALWTQFQKADNAGLSQDKSLSTSSFGVPKTYPLDSDLSGE